MRSTRIFSRSIPLAVTGAALALAGCSSSGTTATSPSPSASAPAGSEAEACRQLATILAPITGGAAESVAPSAGNALVSQIAQQLGAMVGSAPASLQPLINDVKTAFDKAVSESSANPASPPSDAYQEVFKGGKALAGLTTKCAQVGVTVGN